MKLRNIFLAGLAVCTMAGCSKDETTDYSQMGIRAIVHLLYSFINFVYKHLKYTILWHISQGIYV